MNVGCLVMARISASTISTLSVPMPVETHDMRRPLYMPGDRGELAVAVLVARSSRSARRLGRCGPGRRAAGCTRQVRPGRVDVVLPFRVRQRDAAVRVGKLSSSRRALASAVTLGRAETIGSRCAERQPRLMAACSRDVSSARRSGPAMCQRHERRAPESQEHRGRQNWDRHWRAAGRGRRDHRSPRPAQQHLGCRQGGRCRSERGPVPGSAGHVPCVIDRDLDATGRRPPDDARDVDEIRRSQLVG